MENSPQIQIFNNDCLEQMKSIEDKSIDLIFCDLPYGQTSCKWDCKIDLDQFWKQVMRIKKLNTPIFMTTTTKFGVELIQSAPKKCHFRYDLVWVKSGCSGFLSSRRMPLRKHEMVYVFYEKLPLYDLSSHTHKFIKERDTKQKNGKIYEGDKNKKIVEGQYNPPLPVSVVKEPEIKYDQEHNSDLYGDVKRDDRKNKKVYDPPLPTSVVKEPQSKSELYGDITYESKSELYGDIKRPDFKDRKGDSMYNPPLPTSVVKEEYTTNEGIIYNGGKPLNIRPKYSEDYDGKTAYNPPLPTSMLEIKSTRGKHSTEKPVALMEWIFKYYSKEGDTILDPTMGSGSTGVACKNMNRKFIGIEKDEEIFHVAEKRLK